MMRPKEYRAWRDAVRLLLCTLLALTLMVGAALAAFAPLWSTSREVCAPLAELSDSVRVNVNKADVQALCCLPGVGTTRAEEIIAYREQYGPYRYLTDLCYIEGIDLLTIVHWGNMAYTAE